MVHRRAMSCLLAAAALLGCVGAGCAPPAGPSAPADLLEAQGRTMGTVYLVKIANPPEELAADWREQIDAELRQVNDQMSTYLENSELSRFNRSESTDWFGVSPETAMVVQSAQRVSEATGGAFDVTVAPLVDAWGFGPAEPTGRRPEAEELERLRSRVGYSHLEVRADPPALRKAIPQLTVDLSAIAKGHGVDRVVERLQRLGCDSVFVEIGGEVRATGERGDGPWRVGVERPDVAGREVYVALPLRDAAVATSGDYRQFVEIDAVRFSHTIDPRTGRPVEHRVASISVHAENAMMADAWATALNVLGYPEALDMAQQEQLEVLILYRDGDQLRTAATGVFKAVSRTENDR